MKLQYWKTLRKVNSEKENVHFQCLLRHKATLLLTHARASVTTQSWEKNCFVALSPNDHEVYICASVRDAVKLLERARLLQHLRRLKPNVSNRTKSSVRDDLKLSNHNQRLTCPRSRWALQPCTARFHEYASARAWRRITSLPRITRLLDHMNNDSARSLDYSPAHGAFYYHHVRLQRQ